MPTWNPPVYMQLHLEDMAPGKRGRHPGLSRGLEHQLTIAQTPTPTKARAKRQKDAAVPKLLLLCDQHNASILERDYDFGKKPANINKKIIM